VGSGRFKYREEVVEGLENAPAAFLAPGQDLRRAAGEGRV